jgi:hypothetical protein
MGSWLPGDIAIALWETNNSIALTEPAGWTRLSRNGSSGGSGNSLAGISAYKVLDAGDDAAVLSWGMGGSNPAWRGIVAIYRGQHASPIGLHSALTVQTGSAASLQALTPTTSGSWVLAMVFGNDPFTPSPNPPTGLVERESVSGVDQITLWDTNGPTSGYAGEVVGIDAGLLFRSTLELKADTAITFVESVTNLGTGYPGTITLPTMAAASPGIISDTLTTSDSVVRHLGLRRSPSDSARSTAVFTDAFSAALGAEYVDNEGLVPAGGVLTGDSDTQSRSGLDLTIVPPAEVRFDFRTADTGDSAAEVSIGGGRVTLVAISGGNVSVSVDPDLTEVAAVTHIADTLYHVKAMVGVLVGDAVWAKLWKDGDPEPGSPQADFSLPAAIQLGLFSEISLEAGDGATLDNLYIAGFVGDFITTPKALFRAISDTVVTTESVGFQIPTPVDYFRAIEDTVVTTDHISSLIERDIVVEPQPSPRVPVVSVVINGTEMWPVVDFRQTRLTTYANGNPGAGEVWIRDLERLYSFPTGAEVVVKFRGVPVWGGFVMAVRREYVFSRGKGGGLEPRYLVLEVVDYNILFRKRIFYDHDDPTNMVVAHWPNGTFDDTVIADVVSKYLDLDDDGLSFAIQRVGTPALPTDSCNPDAPDEFGVGTGGWTWEQVMAAIASQTGAVWYIDPEKVVRYVDDSTRQSRFGFDGLSDQPGGTKAGYSDLEISFDGAGLVNDQFTWGLGQGSAAPVVGHETDEASIAAHGLWQQAEIRFDMYCQTSVDRRAETWVQGSPQNRRGGKDDKVAIRCTVFNPFFRVGDVVAFENETFDFSDDVPVRGAEITFPTPFDIKMVLTLGHTIDAPWNTHEFLFPDIGLPEFPPPVLPVLPELPPFCLCCGWVPEGTPTEGNAVISSCTPTVTTIYSYFWDFADGVSTFDTTHSIDWSSTLDNSSASDALSNPVGRSPGTSTPSAPRLGRFPVQPGQVVRVSLKGSRNSLSSWGGQPPALARKRYWITWYTAGGTAIGTELIGETYTNRFTFGEVYNEFLVIDDDKRGFKISVEQQQYIDDVLVEVVTYDDADCPPGVGGAYLTPPEPSTDILRVYAPDGTLLEQGVDWQLNPLDPTIILPITTWWVAEGVRIVYIPVHTPHPCDDMEVPDFTIDPDRDGDNSGEEATEGDADVDGTFFQLSQQFLPGSTQVWVDGLRIRLTFDYVEYPLLAKIKILDHIDVGSVSVTAAYTNFVINDPVPT